MGGPCVAVPAAGARGRAAGIAAARAGHLPGHRRRSLAHLVADLARLPGVQMLRLAPLSEAAVARILRAAGVTADPELARFVHARSEGNALYVTTLARLLAAQPGAAADADAVARSRAAALRSATWSSSLLRDLDDGARALLAAASVLGADFDSELAAAVGGTSQDGPARCRPPRPADWSRSCRTAPAPGGSRHALVRDGIYAQPQRGRSGSRCTPRAAVGAGATGPERSGTGRRGRRAPAAGGAGPGRTAAGGRLGRERQRRRRPPRSRSRTPPGTWPPR